MNLRCEPCDLIFNGRIPYEAHLKSNKHIKKLGLSSSKSNIQLDKFIKEFKNEYKCILCNVILNSLEQAQTHMSGKKHRSSAGGKIEMKTSFSPKFSSLETEEWTLSSVSRANESGSSISSAKQNSANYCGNGFTFTFRGIEIKDVMAKVKVFGPNDPLVF